MKVKAIYCLLCHTILYSRARHDCHYCTCGSVAVDGGQKDYLRVIGEPDLEYVVGHIELDVTLRELYEDWNRQTDEFGWILKGNKDHKNFIAKD